MSERLCLYLRVQVALNTVQKDGVSLRAHLEHLAQDGAHPPEAVMMEVVAPEGFEYLADFFWTLSASRGGSGFGPNPISYLELYAWAALMRLELRSWEVQTLVALDQTFLSETVSPWSREKWLKTLQV